MKRLLFSLIITLSVVALVVCASVSLGQDIPKESKEQPTNKVQLDTDGSDDKWGEVPFDHVTHSTLKDYSPDGKSVTSCVECHHTDQPKAGLKPPLEKSERNVELTAAVLKDPAQPPVKSCRACHLQADEDGKLSPKIKEDGKDLKVNNQLAYHRNCEVCHDDAIRFRPELIKKIAGKDPNGCGKCHATK